MTFAVSLAMKRFLALLLLAAGEIFTRGFMNDVKAQADGLPVGLRPAVLRLDAQETLNKSKDE